ncbi:MAG TPA: NADH-quinone oxidoreductase subunit I [Elusimicrobiota bacterium]|nr:NADH-quinone oxidoreductase subunit I [Elusimicrobiota bacterium]
MFDYFCAIGNMGWAFVKGLGVTFKYLFSPAVTVQYPYEKLTPSELFRGALAFHPDLCISCDMCVRACPSNCISLEAKRNEQTKKKDLQWYRIDFAKCNYCRLCEEICPTKPKSVHHSREFELTFTSRNDFVVEWRPERPQPKALEPGQEWVKFLTQGRPPGRRRAKSPEGKK